MARTILSVPLKPSIRLATESLSFNPCILISSSFGSAIGKKPYAGMPRFRKWRRSVAPVVRKGRTGMSPLISRTAAAM